MDYAKRLRQLKARRQDQDYVLKSFSVLDAYPILNEASDPHLSRLGKVRGRQYGSCGASVYRYLLEGSKPSVQSLGSAEATWACGGNSDYKVQ